MDINTFEIIFVWKFNEKYYEEVFHKAYIVISIFQKQPLAGVLQNRNSKNEKFANFTGKHLCWNLFLIKL